MKKLTDVQIKAWITSNTRFEDKADGGGLYLCYRESMASPMWRFRYRYSGKRRQMFIGSYKGMTLSEARKQAKELNARVALGHDVAGEKQSRKSAALAAIEAEKNRITVSALTERYYQERVLHKRVRPEQVHGHLNRLSKYLGKMNVEDVTGKHINAMYQKDLARGYPSSTNKLREFTRKVFGYAAAQHIIPFNPAQWLDISYAGGNQEPRERNLSREELTALFKEMAAVKGFGRENYLTIKLLLLLCVRKCELTKSLKSDFDLDGAVWTLAKGRTKTKSKIDIPLSQQAIDALGELFAQSPDSDYLLPARKAQHNRLPYISEVTLNVALKKIAGIEHFTVHDLRRTAKTKMQELGVDEFISERCLNHKIIGMAGTYGRHDFFEERKKALQLWANYLDSCENGAAWNVTPIRKTK
ncbi:MAG: integrase arm-type DNA-binding domain-containing protein [Methylobacter sp.]|uniref:tyrosine-type recombinase/integrase n=1 Tax=Methylobacter sp. TaxID=2051955 RepID=UPI00258685C3|nr:site-specific integrase [Methylobacter sp.]MCL7421528.1 integrase arm-type DNA-binding domain-containing protein [Methylobacter sp.]